MPPVVCALLGLALVAMTSLPSPSHTLRVPEDHKTIQGAMEAAAPGDTIVVSPGTYRETVRFKERVALRSAGDDARGSLGLKRAELTIIEGERAASKGPGVILAEGAVLDGFTVTGVGVFDPKEYDQHYATNGVNVQDKHGVLGVDGNFPAVAVHGVTATVKNNVVHDNGHAGIGCQAGPGKRNASLILDNVVFRTMGAGMAAVEGATPVIQGNRCFNNLRAGIGSRCAAPIIVGNECFDNVREGIGAREAARSIIRGNKCYRNRQVGISSRHEGTTALIEDNDCFENVMGGIGSREAASVTIRGNRCHDNGGPGIRYVEGASPTVFGNKVYRNKGPGIDCRGGGRALLAHNECFENEQAGIALAGDTEAMLGGNRVHDNKGAGLAFGEAKSAKGTVQHNKINDNRAASILVAGGWTLSVSSNEISRKEGESALIAVAKEARVDLSENSIRGGGKPAVEAAGCVRLLGNTVEMQPSEKACAVQALGGADVTLVGNAIKGGGLVAEKASVSLSNNRFSHYDKVAVRITEPQGTVTALGNVFESGTDKVGIEVVGGPSLLEGNRLEKPKQAGP